MVDGDRRREVEAGGGHIEITVEIEPANLPGQRAITVRGQADFRGGLFQIERILRVRRERDEARPSHQIAAINIPAAEAFAAPVAGDRGQRGEVEFVARCQADAQLLVFRIVPVAAIVKHSVAVVVFVERVGVVRLVRARAQHVSAEESRCARNIAEIDRRQNGRTIARSKEQLPADRKIGITTKCVIFAGKAVVDPITTPLKLGRNAERQHVLRNRTAHRAVQRNCVEAAERKGGRNAGVVAWLDRFDLHDPGRGVAAKQRALRSAQHFDAFNIEDREAFQRHVFEHDIIQQHRNRLRCGEIEIGIAQPANVEARGDAAVGAFDVQARRGAGQRGNIRCAAENRADAILIQNVCRNRHILQVFIAAVGGDDDGGKLAVISIGSGGSVLRSGRRGKAESSRGEHG